MMAISRLGRLMAMAAMMTAAAGTANAQTWTATLSGANEVPPNASLGSGFVTLSLSGSSLTVIENFTGLVASANGAHFHCCAPPGVSVGIAIPFPAFPAATSGSYTNIFNLALTTTYTSGFLSSSGGTAEGAQAAFVAGLNSGLVYANIHDASFPGGEIRGTVVATPEPASMLLLATGLIGIFGVARRRQSA